MALEEHAYDLYRNHGLVGGTLKGFRGCRAVVPSSAPCHAGKVSELKASATAVQGDGVAVSRSSRVLPPAICGTTRFARLTTTSTRRTMAIWFHCGAVAGAANSIDASGAADAAYGAAGIPVMPVLMPITMIGAPVRIKPRGNKVVPT